MVNKISSQTVLGTAIDSLHSIVLDGETRTADLRLQLKAKVAEMQALRAQIAQEEGVETAKARQILQGMVQSNRPTPGSSRG